MFTEQPAQPHPIAEVQVHPAAATTAPQPTASPQRLAVPTPDPATPVVEAPAETPTPAVSPSPAPAPSPTASDPGDPRGNGEATRPSPVAPPAPRVAEPPAPAPPTQTTRKQEVEQLLLTLTRQAREQHAAAQAQQAAMDAAKYGEAEDLDELQRVVTNPALPANVKAALVKRLQAKLTQKGIKPATVAEKLATPKPTPSPGQGLVTGRSPAVSLEISGRNYGTAPIVPFTQAQLRLRFGKLFGRNLSFAFPLSIPAPVTSLFGWRIHPISGSPRFHRGIDFGAPTGTPIVAAKAGRVDVATVMDGYGLTVVVQHDQRWQTLYAHMSQIYVQPGETVKKGQLLGLVGSTGNSTGPHLHFEIHEQTSEGWVALDPAIALNAAIALTQNPALAAQPSTKPHSFNLAMSGLLDLNAPVQPLAAIAAGNTLLSGLLTGTHFSPTRNPLVALPLPSLPNVPLELPLAFLPPAVPELGLLLSPWMEDWMEQMSVNLPGLMQVLSLQVVPSLSQVSPFSAIAPGAGWTAERMPSVPLHVANQRALSGVTLADQLPNPLPNQLPNQLPQQSPNPFPNQFPRPIPNQLPAISLQPLPRQGKPSASVPLSPIASPRDRP